ncbi:hypothetical protein BGZ70_008231 [Mortierella alpina]|uniref:Uncharacterized protein n=1 Tax=Mortierella alpina TaxID=64518 RepID=A0A9P6J775_MORAP|nr:hypothetical protein BGZ70_008231 [Mortierella alpina]
MAHEMADTMRTHFRRLTKTIVARMRKCGVEEVAITEIDDQDDDDDEDADEGKDEEDDEDGDEEEEGTRPLSPE